MGTKKWFWKGRLHREDGPAVEYPSGKKCWYLNGNLVYGYDMNNINQFNIPKKMKMSIIKHKLNV
jgi:hypothetical protein